MFLDGKQIVKYRYRTGNLWVFSQSSTAQKNRKCSPCCTEQTNKKYGVLKFSVADPGCLSRIPDPNFSVPDSGSRVKMIQDPDPHKRIKIFLTKKIVSKLSEI
jgi:hypothetical protein